MAGRWHCNANNWQIVTNIRHEAFFGGMVRIFALCTVVFAVSAGVAGCSSSKPSSSTAGPPTSSAAPSTALVDACTADKAGGTLTFGEFLQPTTLDPVNPSGARGVLGGTEMTAI